jgi:hypothetical protein
MTTIEFRKMYEAQPFRPFTIGLADGREIPVRHREFVMLSPSGRTAHVYQPDDSFDIIDLLLVTRLRVNGKRSSARKRA